MSKKTTEHEEVIAFRLPKATRKELKNYADSQQRTVSNVIRMWIEDKLSHIKAGRKGAKVTNGEHRSAA